MHQDVSVGAAVRILANCDLCEDTGIPRLEPLPGQLQQPAEDLTIRVVSNPGAGPIDVDAKVERMSDLMGESGRSVRISDLRLCEPLRLSPFGAGQHLRILRSVDPITSFDPITRITTRTREGSARVALFTAS